MWGVFSGVCGVGGCFKRNWPGIDFGTVPGNTYMRIWDISPRRLCRNHLLAEHRELHAIWNILTMEKKGYSKHPETLRWKGKLKALYSRHQEQVKELERREYNHKSPLEYKLAKGQGRQDRKIDPVKTQIKILKSKNCQCKV